MYHQIKFVYCTVSLLCRIFTSHPIIIVNLTKHFLLCLMQRIASHIQVFALSRWLPVTLPVDYYEFSRGIQWSIPYLSLPWETGRIHPIMVGLSSPTASHSYASTVHDSGNLKILQPKGDKGDMAASVYGLPLTPVEYRTFFEVGKLSSFHNQISL